MDSRIEEVNRKIEDALSALHEEIEREDAQLPPPPKVKGLSTQKEILFHQKSSLRSLGMILFWLWVPAVALWVGPAIYKSMSVSSVPPIVFEESSDGDVTRLVYPDGRTRVQFSPGEPLRYEIIANKRRDCAPPLGRVDLEYRAWIVGDERQRGWVPIPYSREGQLPPGRAASRQTVVPMPKLPTGNYLFQWIGSYYCSYNSADRNPWIIAGPLLPFTISTEQSGASTSMELPEQSPFARRGRL